MASNSVLQKVLDILDGRELLFGGENKVIELKKLKLFSEHAPIVESGVSLRQLPTRRRLPSQGRVVLLERRPRQARISKISVSYCFND